MKKIVQMILVIIIAFTYTYAGYAGSTEISTDKAGSSTAAGVNSAKPTGIEAGAFILIDLKSGQVLFEKDSEKEHMYPASTTKMLTAAIACDIGDMDQMMTASKAAVYDIGKDGMNIGIMPGEQISLNYLLHALLISSANETANIIAENLCATRQEFIDLMNKKASELGCEGTHFVNPCGAHDPDHYTTAADLSKIARYAMTFPKFREIVSKISFPMMPTNKHTEWPVLYTTNKLLRYQKSDAPYKITGIKTGYTGQAGNNLVSSAENPQGMELIAVVMNVTGVSSSDRAVQYSRQLFDYGFSNFSEKQLLQKGQIVQSIPVVEAADEEPLDLIADDGFKYIIENGSEDISLIGKHVINSDVTAPINKGDILGYLQYEKNGEILGKINLVASRSVNKKEQNVTMSIKTSNPLKNVILILLAILAFFILLRIILKQISRNLRKKRYKF